MPRLLPRARSGDAAPRVLIVDDHPGMLGRISAVLDGFSVVGMATNGTQAVELASQVSPDVIVLDINMPGLSGFATRRALAQSGSRAPVVFLSALDGDEYVAEALRCGGQGYVVKPYLARDLASALEQVLHGRVFVPSLSALHQSIRRGGHVMHVHRSEESFADAIASCFHAVLHRGEAACVIGPASLRAGVAAHLRARGWDLDAGGAASRYRALDSDAALAVLLRDGLPDAGRLTAMVDELDEYRRTVCSAASSRLTIGGYASGRLVAAGNTAGALAIEHLWNTLTSGRPFLTVCGYLLASLHEDAPDAWPAAAEEHMAVCHACDI